MPDHTGARRHVGIVRRAVVRPMCTIAILLLAYFLLPFEGIANLSAVVLVAIGGLLVATVCLWEVRRILRADHPVAQAAEALTMTFGVHLIGYATVYYLLAAARPSDFSLPLTRLDALYFCVTVFATVGFGDIVPTAEISRAFVLTQMIGNVVLLGLAVRLLTASVRTRRTQLRDTGAGEPGAA